MIQIENKNEIAGNKVLLENLINDPIKRLKKEAKDYDKKVLEICHVGKFLMLQGSDYRISQVREQPDFIIESSQGKKVGLEHVRIVDPEYKKIEGSFSDLIKTTESLFRKRHPNTNLLVNIYVNPQKKISKKEKPKLVEQLLLLIQNSIFNSPDKKIVENDLVHDIYFRKHSKLIFNCNTGAWWQQFLEPDIVTEFVHKKELKRQEYIRNTKLNEQWLLLVIGSLDQSSYELDERLSKKFQVDSGFSRVFIMEDFNARLFEV